LHISFWGIHHSLRIFKKSTIIGTKIALWTIHQRLTTKKNLQFFKTKLKAHQFFTVASESSTQQQKNSVCPPNYRIIRFNIVKTENEIFSVVQILFQGKKIKKQKTMEKKPAVMWNFYKIGFCNCNTELSCMISTTHN